MANAQHPTSGAASHENAPQSAQQEQTAAGKRAPEESLPPVDFQTLAISLGSSVLMHLGAVPDLEGAKTSTDLVLAKHSIDMLAMLQEKTRGNLTQSEADLLQGLLYDLRLKYLEAARK